MDINKLRQLHPIEDEVDDILDVAEELGLPAVDLTPRPKQVVKEVSGGKAMLEVTLEEGDEIIDGKLYKANQFKPGNKAHSKAVMHTGPRNETIQRKMWQIRDRRAFKHFMSTVVMERTMDALMELEGKDLITAFISLAPYCLPKIATVEFKSDDPISIDEFQKSKQSVVIIKSMSTGLTKTIVRE